MRNYTKLQNTNCAHSVIYWRNFLLKILKIVLVIKM